MILAVGLAYRSPDPEPVFTAGKGLACAVAAALLLALWRERRGRPSRPDR